MTLLLSHILSIIFKVTLISAGKEKLLVKLMVLSPLVWMVKRAPHFGETVLAFVFYIQWNMPVQSVKLNMWMEQLNKLHFQNL